MDPTPQFPSRQQLLSASSTWVAVLLNVVPGLGTGYIYQRRWRAYWITSAAAAGWFALGAAQAADIDPELMADVVARNQLVGLAGFLVLALVTAIEAGVAVRRSRA
ncbi:hypothetical protein KBY96_04700 [Cyanobium sp. ATX 6A2]|uniref:hypothetical protein n=1 Tax=Cyanobium sp. ATX 6A2 TaxID=2823700 RepID=UPI0020CC30B3|nr:hypothetical protein [Cyanobium sp. ATX 6A2]MCP9887234.1 hypothetical protein [Cyanobium sp. ATX 6A2]